MLLLLFLLAAADAAEQPKAQQQSRQCFLEGHWEHACYALPFYTYYHGGISGQSHSCFVTIRTPNIDANSAAQECRQLATKYSSQMFMQNPWMDIQNKDLADIVDEALWNEMQENLIVPQDGYSHVKAGGLFKDGKGIPSTKNASTAAGYICELKDTTQPPMCQNNVLGGKPYRSTCYYLTDRPVSPSDFANACGNLGATPAVITDDNLNQYIAREVAAQKGIDNENALVLVSGSYNQSASAWMQFLPGDSRQTDTSYLQYYRWFQAEGVSFSMINGGGSVQGSSGVGIYYSNKALIARFGYWAVTSPFENSFYGVCEKFAHAS